LQVDVFIAISFAMFTNFAVTYFPKMCLMTEKTPSTLHSSSNEGPWFSSPLLTKALLQLCQFLLLCMTLENICLV